MNKLYISPEFEILRVEMIEDVIMASPENYSSYVPDPIDLPSDPVEEPDPDIDW